MIFSRVATFVFAALPILAAATPLATRGEGSAGEPGSGSGGGSDGKTGGKCSTGSLQCCNTLNEADSASIAGLLDLVGVALGDLNGLVGVQCSPIDVIGVLNGNDCDDQVACCTNNNVGGLVSTGCIPVSL
ncbi:fungal hydrophobin-domain-containing protein [Trametes meyenii]|nr:fungal hydrophobin-domain-containing protein [Trametes meyenii]